MKSIISTVGVLGVIGTVLVGTAARAEDRPSAPSDVTASRKAKIGDEVACAVDGMKMPLQFDTPTTELHGQVYYFCSDAEKQQFLKSHERHDAKP